MLPPPSGGGAIKGHINPGTPAKPDDVPFDGPNIAKRRKTAQYMRCLYSL